MEDLCFFASDLHGKPDRYRKLFAAIARERPRAVFLGGDLFPHALAAEEEGFLADLVAPELRRLVSDLGAEYPQVFTILGNDDPRSAEREVLALEAEGLWRYAHGQRLAWRDTPVYGYACVPPTPFANKDWERYDVSRYVDPGCVSPEEGRRTVPVPPEEARYGTISRDLAVLAGDSDVSDSIFLFHTPPYRTSLDRAALDGHACDSVPLDVHVGSIAVARFLEERQPRASLHGHVHESVRLTGTFVQRIGERTLALGAAHDGPELALVRFSPSDPAAARRTLL